MPYLKKIPGPTRRLQQEVNRLEGEVNRLQKEVNKQGAFPAGHYYSPIPAMDEVLEYFKSRKPLNPDLIDVNLNAKSQFELLNEYSEFYKDLPFLEKPEPGCRYYYDNNWFSYSDAIFLFGFLRKHKPKRIIEVGSGFSSAVILDTVDGFFSHRPQITFIDPDPNRLNSLLRKDDKGRVEVLEKKIQEVPSELFSSLESGDFLFIDSSHAVKCGSDVQLLMFEILPLLPPGVFVHFHDVFYPFEYPAYVIERGNYWNENYFLRAFLSYNHEWSTYFFNDYVASSFNDFIKDKMPLCTRNSGGSLYIQRKGKG
jgi:predicted O-methyltransferase YrrM